VHILEGRDTPYETGAGLQLGPHAVKVLGALGLADTLAPLAHVPAAIRIMTLARSEPLVRVPLGEHARQRYGAPYWCLHRQDLHRALSQAVAREPRSSMTFGFRCSTLSDDGQTVSVHDRAGQSATGAGLVGADGLWSEVRRALEPEAGDRRRATFSGYTAWRTLLAVPQGQAAANEDVVLWLAPDAHVVQYPVSGGDALNLVVVIREPEPEAGFDNAGDTGQLLGGTAWPAPLRSLLERATDWRRWALYERPHNAPWAQGRVLLAGDAAHPVLPFLAQGAAMALEDAWAIGAALRAATGDLEVAWQGVERYRRPRIARVVGGSRRNAWCFHLAGLAGHARDLALRGLGGHRLLSAYDWLYGYAETENRQVGL
jgi:salicylate hydroxylase